MPVEKNTISLKNETNQPQVIQKRTPIADIRSCALNNTKTGKNQKFHPNDQVFTNQDATPVIEKVSTYLLDPISMQFPSNWDYSEDFTADVSIDPDNTMSADWKRKFREQVN